MQFLRYLLHFVRPLPKGGQHGFGRIIERPPLPVGKNGRCVGEIAPRQSPEHLVSPLDRARFLPGKDAEADPGNQRHQEEADGTRHRRRRQEYFLRRLDLPVGTVEFQGQVHIYHDNEYRTGDDKGNNLQGKSDEERSPQQFPGPGREYDFLFLIFSLCQNDVIVVRFQAIINIWDGKSFPELGICDISET